MTKASITATLGLLVLGGLAFSPRCPPTVTDPQALRIAELQAEIARLRRELADHGARERRAQTAAAPRPVIAACSSAPALTVSPPCGPVKADARVDPPEPPDPIAPEDFILEAFAAEADDARWARATEGQLQSKIADRLPTGSSVDSVECRSVLCRVTTVHRSQDAIDAFQLQAFKEESTRVWGGDAFTYIESEDEGGELAVVSYVAREGHPLPSP
jgi:hypothetical protein